MLYQQNLIWSCNPFFLYVAFGCWLDKDGTFEKDKKNNYRKPMNMIQTMFLLEFKNHSRSEHIQITERIRSYFLENEDFYEILDGSPLEAELDFFNLFYDILPILNLTYLFSFYIACREELRTEFYDAYQGKIPAITQFLLNSIRRGPIDQNTYVSEIQFDSGSYDLQIGSALGSAMDLRFEEFCCPLLLSYWFKQLEMHCSNHKLFFYHFVELQKVPLDSEETVTLTGFNQVNPQFLSIAKGESLLAKKNYVLINQAINAFLVEENYYKKHEWPIDSDDSRMLGGGKDLKKWISRPKNSNYESPLMAPLLDFIIHCHSDNL